MNFGIWRNRRLKRDAKSLLQFARRLLRYKQDIFDAKTQEQLCSKMGAVAESMKAGDRESIQRAVDSLNSELAVLYPRDRTSYWRDNIEIILVVVVVVIGLRSYFLQPFKIPTGSMQPTLNGIIGRPSSQPAPNLARQVAEYLIYGRNYIDVVSQEDDRVVQIVPKSFTFFFTFSRLVCEKQSFLVYCPRDTLRQDFKVLEGNRYKRGEVIARGAVDTGDQVFVDKVSYNFVKPHVGDVFVFRTDHIYGIAESPETGAPFFIKRLAGTPGDRLRIDPPNLYVNGAKAPGFGFERVMNGKPPYRGYSLGPREYLSDSERTYRVPEHGYFAMGDNSYNSYDSRYWGPVPERNIVGRGLFVWWPFIPHAGIIR